MTGYKTIVLGIVAAASAILGWLIGEVPGDQAFMAVWGLLMVIFARVGVDLRFGGWLAGFKTYITAVLGMLTSLVGMVNGQLSLEQFITAIVMGFLGIFYRQGIKKSMPGTVGNRAHWG